jgi:hydrogenase-4 component F
MRNLGAATPDSCEICVTDVLVTTVLALPVLAAAALALPRGSAATVRLNTAGAVLVAASAGVLAVIAMLRDEPLTGSWYVVDRAGGVFLLVVAVVGLLSALASPSYLAGADRSFFVTRRSRPHVPYYAAFYLFWATLLAVPLVDNLAVAWLLIEATTAASALLVASTGRRSALEAGWKYLVLTTLGLAVALLGILALYASIDGASLAALDWTSIQGAAAGIDPDAALFALALILTGLATKIGWAPVHNWLPDAHSEAPPPVSALLSAALLPTVMLVAWRAQLALEPAVGGTGSGVFLGFGLASLAVAVPFLWQTLPLKRLLAYSSLEHMGILALGIGFVHPLATAGVVLHVAGHALAKSLGFYAAIPLLRSDPSLSRRPARALAARSPAGAAAVGVSLASLSGLPPSPLFFSELLILLGGLAAGEPVVVIAAALLLALGFLGLVHALIEGVVSGRKRKPARNRRTERRLATLTLVMTLGLLALSAIAYALPDSDLVRDLMGPLA